ncbi:Detected protein of unknown function [Hibiscus syriacus]|uniref:Uncharacterized protein n=1 Tax=Hibiscus syriacus TaxID=106335 RepID=A0A6A2XIE4_HIBSY|nr:Detected protein of unknown function [Hibiscus syriacus]
MGNMMKAIIEGVRTCRIVLDTSYCLNLEKCLYVPDCSRNLIYVSRLDVLGFDFRIGHGTTSDRGLLHDVKGYLFRNFEMNDMGETYTRSDIACGRYVGSLSIKSWTGPLESCKDSFKFTFGYVFLLADVAISWNNDKQFIIATSTMEAEFVTCFEAIVQSLCLHNFVIGLGIISTIAKPLRIYCDNATDVFFSKNDRYSRGAKHMNLKYLSVKEEVQNQRVQIVHIGTNDIIVDLLTKGLVPKTFIGPVSEMGVIVKSLYSG